MYDFGPNAAQDDPDLLKYFHITKQVSNLFTLDSNFTSRCIFVARPGSGKTALVKWLESEAQQRNVLLVKPSETRFVIEDNYSNVEDYRILISAELLTGILSEAKKKQWLSKNLLEEFDEFSKLEWLKSKGESLLKKFEGLTFLGFGFTLKADDRKSYMEEIRRSKTIEKLRDLVAKLAKEIRITLVVDDPEFIASIGLDDVSEPNAKRIGAFLSVLNHIHSLGIRVVVFTKEHILQSIQEYYRDFSHFENRIEGLEWTREDFSDMLILRMEKRFNGKWSDVFDITPEEFQKIVLPCLINGPRDLLTICNTAGQSGLKISKAILEKSINAYRTTKWRDIRTQYSTQWPSIDVFARAVITLVSGKFGNKLIKPAQFRLAVEEEFQSPGTSLHDLRKQEDWINTALWASPSIEERLYLIGVLGYNFQQLKYFPWSGRSLERFRLADAYFISPLFL